MAGGLFNAAPATAAPPSTWYNSAPDTVIVCDSEAQIRSIVEAGRRDNDGGAFNQFSAYTKQMNAAREPACTIINVNVAVAESVELGTFHIFADIARRGWAVHIKRGPAEGWMLYTEAPDTSRALASLGQ
jgi:hypothetical protein